MAHLRLRNGSCGPVDFFLRPGISQTAGSRPLTIVCSSPEVVQSPPLFTGNQCRGEAPACCLPQGSDHFLCAARFRSASRLRGVMTSRFLHVWIGSPPCVVPTRICSIGVLDTPRSCDHSPLRLIGLRPWMTSSSAYARMLLLNAMILAAGNLHGGRQSARDGAWRDFQTYSRSTRTQSILRCTCAISTHYEGCQNSLWSQ